MTNGRSVTTPGTSALKKVTEGATALTVAEHRLYRSIVGKIIWLTPLRPDVAYSIKELSRAIQSPTIEDISKAKHLTRYLLWELEIMHFT